MTRNNPTILLSEAFPDWSEGSGIFSALSDMPWDEDVDSALLDLDYFGNHSGYKKCSPIVYRLMNSDYEVPAASRELLASLIAAKYKPNWVALWNSYHFDYNPIDLVSVTEHKETQGSDAHSTVATKTRGDSSETSSEFTHGEHIEESNSLTTDDDSSLVHGEQIQEASEEEGSSENSKYGFNSNAYSPVDKNEQASSSSVTTTHSGTDATERDISTSESKEKTHSGTDAQSSSTSAQSNESNSENGVRANEETYDKTITGTNGAFSRQKLIKEERELWQSSFFDKVYEDVDDVLASSVYIREHRLNPWINTGRNI